MLLRLKMKKIFILFFYLFLLTNCSTKTSLKLEKANYSNLKNWHKDRQDLALKAFSKSCSQNKAVIQAKIYSNAPKNLVKQEWSNICKATQNKNFNKKEARAFIESRFVPFLVKGRKGKQGLFTGYYEVELEGSITKTNKYRHPVYLHSANVNTKLPRSKIEQGALKGKKLEVAYVKDRVGLFFMHIQGSGKVRISDNSYIKLGYAGQNGYPYFPIGNYLTKNNHINKNTASAESIIKWLNNNPHLAAKVMNLNESYVYFKQRREHHPVGAMGVEVTPMRTLAVDRSFIPLGSLLWLETSYPRENKKLPLRPFNRVMVAQDVGGAIKGEVRGDVFFGSSKQAERYAWYMANKGQYYILVPKAIANYIK